MENLDLSIDNYSKLVKWLESVTVQDSIPQGEPITLIAIDEFISEYLFKHKISGRKPNFKLRHKSLLLEKYNAKNEFTYSIDGLFFSILTDEFGKITRVVTSKKRRGGIWDWNGEIKSEIVVSMPLNFDLIKMFFLQFERILETSRKHEKKRLLKKSLLMKSGLSHFKEIFSEICPDFHIEINSKEKQCEIKIHNPSRTWRYIIRDGVWLTSLIANPEAMRGVSVWISSFANITSKPDYPFRDTQMNFL